MKKPSVLSEKVVQQHAVLRDILDEVIALAADVGDAEGLTVLQARRKTLDSAALFVVVGEVKSGKSSFINALLGEEVCEVAPDPCTVTIQELVFGEERSRLSLGDHWERVALPKEVLRQVTIVDTPGTNSIIRQHQAVTERYIPLSDLAIFVFPAKNPHTATAWEFLSLLRKDWHRRVVFVLQQSDTASQSELAVNRQRVVQYAHERGVQAPTVFVVSAKRETEGASDSGFPEFREFIRKTVESGDVWRMKFEGARDTTAKLLAHLLETLSQAQAALADDQAFLQRLRAKLVARREKAHRLRTLVVENFCGTYDSLARRLEHDFKAGLSVSSILRRSIPVVRDIPFQVWLKQLQLRFEKEASEQIEADAARISKDLADEMQSMLDEVTREIETRQKHLGPDLDRLGADRAGLLERIRAGLNALKMADIAGEKGLGGTNLGSLALTGGGLAAIGALIALTTKLIVFDITGGALAAVGITVMALVLLWKRGAVLADFSRTLEHSRTEFRIRLDQEITTLFERLFQEVEHIVAEPAGALEERIGRLKPQISRAQELSDRIANLSPP